jgi:hypothetical protein
MANASERASNQSWTCRSTVTGMPRPSRKPWVNTAAPATWSARSVSTTTLSPRRARRPRVPLDDLCPEPARRGHLRDDAAFGSQDAAVGLEDTHVPVREPELRVAAAHFRGIQESWPGRVARTLASTPAMPS